MASRRTLAAVTAVLVAGQVGARGSAAHADGTPAWGASTDLPDNHDQNFIWKTSHDTNGQNAYNQGIQQANDTYFHIYDGVDGDARVYEQSDPNSWYGDEYCSSVNWLTELCDYQHVIFNTRTTAALSSTQWKALGCHEFGHVFGLSERSTASNDDPADDSCMVNPLPASPAVQFDSGDLYVIDNIIY